MPVPVAIIGSGNIGTDLMFKVKRLSTSLAVVAVAGVDEASDGLARARRPGIATTHRGVEGFLDMTEAAQTRIVFDATSAGAHRRNYELVRDRGMVTVDLTPAAIGPYVVPSVNLGEHLSADNINMVTCGGQATVPIVAAVSRVSHVDYAEIVASIASRSAGPGTRANIDEFTVTTASAVEAVGGADKGKAIIILNPAEPPLVMRDTVFCLVEEVYEKTVVDSVAGMVQMVQGYVPGYRLKHQVVFEAFKATFIPALERGFDGVKISVFLEVAGAGYYLPPFAGNLDIMTSAALRAGERIAENLPGTLVRGGSPATPVQPAEIGA